MFNIKFYTEKRAEYEKEMNEMLDLAQIEERALSEEEAAKFDELEKKIKNIDKTLEAEERARALELTNESSEKKTEELRAEDVAKADEKAFANYVRGVVSEQRAENLVSADNGAIVPTSIANKIISKVYDICPLYAMSDRYPVKGTLSIPYYEEDSTSAITMAYASETAALTANSGKFKSIELKGFLAGALAKVPKTLVNNSDFALTEYIVSKMAESMAKWIENELLNGTTDKITGLSNATQVVTAAASSAVTADELIELQEQIPDIYQAGSIFVMNKATRTAIRKLKDNDGQYLLNKDATAKWGYTLFGADVFVSDSMPTMETGKAAVYYLNPTGLATKLAEDVNIEILREKYADQHCLGVVGFVEIDGKIQDQQKVAVLKMK
jgi:HK97 family phage major capsid protein